MGIACPRRFARDAGKRKPKAAEDEPHSAAPSHFPEYSKRLPNQGAIVFGEMTRLDDSNSRDQRPRDPADRNGRVGHRRQRYGSMAPQHDHHSTPAIPAALDRGLNWIETAALYGLGHSGEMLARAIQGQTPKPYVFTKCERVWDENGNIGAWRLSRSGVGARIAYAD